MRYFFNSVDGGVDTDKVGMELDDLDAARLHAVRFAADLLKDNALLLWKGRDFRVEITDATHLVLSTLIIIGIDSAAVANTPSS